ncbi:MAG: hypoxanthine phosphoribosyltransferase [Bacilli bacterium]|nr:hypoxanthine phosphoribosyltransferase [Bacilli bacterium]
MGEVILSQQQIKDICKRVASEITETIKNDEKIPLLIGVMKGALNFMFDLINYIDVPIYTDYIQISSYIGSKRGDNIRLIKDVSFDCSGRTVIIIEDIIDSGYSMKFLMDHIKQHNPKKVLVCSLFDKKNARKVPVDIDFVGHELAKNDFLIGYGLDYNELGRNLPYVISASEEDIKQYDEIFARDRK